MISWMIDHGKSVDGDRVDLEHLHATLDTLRVTGSCGCGTCINLTLSNGTRPIGRHRVILNAHGPHEWLLLLFIDDGTITELEIAPASNDYPVVRLPSSSELTAPQYMVTDI